jgi:hypothetical protein
MESGDQLQDATEPTHLPKLNLKPNILEPAPLLSHLRPASLPREASDWPSEGGSTLKEEKGKAHEEGGEEEPHVLSVFVNLVGLETIL